MSIFSRRPPRRRQTVFRDRAEAGRLLAGWLTGYAGRSDVVVLALPRGGVPVAREVAVSLGAALDLFTVRKLGVPGREELAMGAIASGGVLVLNDDVVHGLGISRVTLERVAEQELCELTRRESVYRGHRPAVCVREQVVILVDDGLATGASTRAALTALRQLAPRRIVVAAPVGPPSTCAALAQEADEVVCPFQPDPFHGGVAAWYQDFEQTTDQEVCRLLEGAGERPLRAQL